MVTLLFAVLTAAGWWLAAREVSPAAPVQPGQPTAPAGRASTGATTGTAASAVPTPVALPGTARDALSRITIRPKEPLTGYSRSMFGPGWQDVEGNGCDARNDVLRRDLSEVELRPRTNGCIVERGRLTDPYTGEVVSFERGTDTSGLVTVDHVVPLGNAWRTGARHWTPAQRVAFYNDPLELLAVRASTNQAKDGSDAAGWLPPRVRSRCAFVARVVAVKTRYGLWMTQAEHDAVERVLTACPGEPLPRG